MPSVFTNHGGTPVPRWGGAPKALREHSTTQDSALWNRNEIPPRLMRNMPEGKIRKENTTSESHYTSTPPHNESNNPGPNHSTRSSPRSPWERHKTSQTVIATGKRKAGIAIKPPPARRRKIESNHRNVNMQDEEFMRQTMELPTKEEYPDLPQGILDSPKPMLHNMVQGLMRLHSSFIQKGGQHLRCHAFCTIPDRERIEVIGEGKNKKQAEKAAYLHLLGKLHESGLLRELLNQPKIDKIDKDTLKEERHAKLDIYNYAARFGCTPLINIQTIASNLPGGNHPGRRKPGRKTIQVTVELPDQNIKVSGHGQTLATAEIAASIKFKEAAEKYHAEKGTSSLTIKDSTSLSVDNARSFFDWYKIHYPHTKVEAVATEEQALRSLSGGGIFQGKILIDDNAVGQMVTMNSKKKAEDLAYLSAGIEVIKKGPSLLSRFLKAPRSGSGEILKPMSPIDMPVDGDCVLLMRDTLLNARRLGLTDEQEELESEEGSSDTRRGRFRQTLQPVAADARSIQLKWRYREYRQREDLAELRRKREELPMNQYRAKVLDIVNDHTYSIVIGATGSGKTTQVPQILLEQAIDNNQAAACNIICTQPRRIAATSVARRVADERAERLQDTIGYHVRFDAKLPSVGGSVTYCTTGILLQQLQHSPDEVLDATSHLIIDEVHERDMQIDFLLIILKKVMAQRIALKRPTPKVVLMSATMDAELFASYFKNPTHDGGVVDCPTLSVPGRTFPVKEQHLETILATLDKTYGSSQLGVMYSDVPTRQYFEVEKTFAKENPSQTGPVSRMQEEEEDESIIDWKQKRVVSADGEIVVFNEKEEGLVPVGLVATTIAHITKTTADGAILVFLPGLDEMVKVDELLRTSNVLGVDFQNASKFKMYMLHSSIPEGQATVFNPVPEGCRKIILGTNIAETSITIPDVQYVVDTGKLREKQYDQTRRITKLQCTWVSKSNSKQRAGRAGRVQNGHYYALFSKARYDSFRAIGLPELLRADLQETCLDVKAQSFKTPIREFLAEAIEPPTPSAVNSAVLSLQSLDALTDEEKLTALGRLLSSLPVHPQLGKMIVLGVIFRCLDPMLLLGAAAEERGIFLNPLQARQAAHAARLSFVQGSGSDHIAFLNAFRQMRQLRENGGQSKMWDFANRYFIHQGAFKSVDNTAKQIEEVLVDAGLIPYTAPHARENCQYGNPALNENSNKVHVIKALALAGLHPNLGVATGGRPFRTVGEKGAIIHPSSVNSTKDDRRGEGHKYGTMLTYSTMARSNDGNTIFMRETSETTPLMACLFGGRLQASQSSNRLLEMDDWLPFYVKSDDRRAVKTIVEFRKALERLLTGAFKDLQDMKRGAREVGVKRGYLAEDRVRECFADGLVEVLMRDVRPSEKTVGRGWGRENQGVEDLGYLDDIGRGKKGGNGGKLSWQLERDAKRMARKGESSWRR